MSDNFYSDAESTAHCGEGKFTLQAAAARLRAPANSAASSLHADYAVPRKALKLATAKSTPLQLAARTPKLR